MVTIIRKLIKLKISLKHELKKRMSSKFKYHVLHRKFKIASKTQIRIQVWNLFKTYVACRTNIFHGIEYLKK